MAYLTIAADFGSSLTKAICSMSSGYSNPQLILLNPQLRQVPKKSIENYETYKIGQAKPEDSAWVKSSKKYFAVGNLAQKNFNALYSLDSLTIDSLLIQILALVGTIAQNHGLSYPFSISLGILLPWNHWKERESFKSQLSLALANYVFR